MRGGRWGGGGPRWPAADRHGARRLRSGCADPRGDRAFTDRPLEWALARRYIGHTAARLQRLSPVVVGITGSYGKTSTKSYVAHLLSGSHSVVASPRSFNNRAGLARAVNESLVEGADVFVAEMGAYGAGEIAELVSWLHPRVAAITAIGPVHLERFGSLERTVAAKREIFGAAEVAVLNVDDERLAPLASELAAAGLRVIRCSAVDKTADVAVVAGARGASLYVAGSLAGGFALDDQRPVALEQRRLCRRDRGRAGGAPAGDRGPGCDRCRRSSTGCRSRPRRRGSSCSTTPSTRTRRAPGSRSRHCRRSRDPTGARSSSRRGWSSSVGGNDPRTRPSRPRSPISPPTSSSSGRRTGAPCLLGAAPAGRPVDPRARPFRVTTVPTCAAAVAWVRQELQAGDAVLYENDLPDQYP